MNTSSDSAEGPLSGFVDDQAPTLIPPSHTQSSERKDPLLSESPRARLFSDVVPAKSEETADERALQAALAASTRAEASLSGLMRTLKTLASGVSSAREANVELVREIEALRDRLQQSTEERRTLESRIDALEAALEEAQRAAASDRAFLIDQHDQFIARLIEDHEQVLSKVTSELAEARQRARTTPPPPLVNGDGNVAKLREQLDAAQRGIEKLVAERDRTREALLRLQAQRDEAQSQVVRLSRERDLARAELAQLRIQQGLSDVARGPSSRPPSGAVRSAASSYPPGELEATSGPVIGQVRLTRTSSPAQASPSPASSSRSGSSGGARPTAPPLEFKPSSSRPGDDRDALPLGAALAEAEERAFAQPDAHPVEHGARPTGSYSVTEASEEHIDVTRLVTPRTHER